MKTQTHEHSQNHDPLQGYLLYSVVFLLYFLVKADRTLTKISGSHVRILHMSVLMLFWPMSILKKIDSSDKGCVHTIVTLFAAR